jgi:T4 RnlA family RNA ligase
VESGNLDRDESSRTDVVSSFDRMTNLPFNPKILPTLIEQGYILSQTHPSLPLTIYNYTAKAQYDKYWNDATLHCRGLVLDRDYQTIARPLPKFFNLQEYQGNLPDGVPNIYEKLDGSLIILFYYQGKWEVASRGSFASEQANMARVLFADYQAHVDELDREHTYLFEIIYPSNRIVVDYGAAQRLVLLAVVHTQTGVELNHEDVNWSDKAATYPATAVPEWVKSIDEQQAELNNHEGFILKWPNGFRLKYKLADYVRLHRIITRVQAKDIWECLSQNHDLAQFLDSVPDEFYNWVKDTKVELEAKYQAIETECLRAFKEFRDGLDGEVERKEWAIYFQKQQYPGVLFLMLDRRDYAQVIWKLIKPDYQRPFRSDPEELVDMQPSKPDRQRQSRSDRGSVSLSIEQPASTPLDLTHPALSGTPPRRGIKSEVEGEGSNKTLKLILTKGLPASGKTTWAKEYIQKYPETANICKDDLRLQLGATNKREKRVVKVRDLLTEYYFGQGYSVIWSDTNLNPVHIRRATELVEQHQAKLVIQDFTDVPLVECIRRDLLRSNSVGQQAIEQMYYDYLDQPDPPPVIDPALPNCYIVDIDGTLAVNTTRSPFAWDRVHEDSIDPAVAMMVEKLGQHDKIIIFSGRSSVCRDLTIAWLKQHQIKYEALFMRPTHDNRSDDILKSELYHLNIRGRYNVLGVIDDRPKVCRMWRNLGLTVFQVGNPDYEF